MAVPEDAAGSSAQPGPSAEYSLQPLSDADMASEGAWALLDAAPDGIIVVDETGRILLLNRQTEDLFGYDRGELLGRSVDDLLPERLRQVHRARPDLVPGRTTGETNGRRNGPPRPAR